MSYNRLYDDLSKDNHVLDTYFISELKNGNPMYKKWTFYKDKVYISYYHNGNPTIEERFLDKNKEFDFNYISHKDFIKKIKIHLRKQKIEKL